MNIGITISQHAYTPESYAYKNFLEKNGYKVQLDFESNLDPNNDLNIFFMGMRPFWKRKEGKALEIHEYQSLSTGSLPRTKDFIKRVVNTKPNGRIFLNSIVMKNINFQDSIPYIYRDMGVDAEFFQKPSHSPSYDIVYCGSIAGRVGLIEVLLKLAKVHKVIVIGHIDSYTQKLFSQANIEMTGKLSRKDIPKIYREAKFGLNFTPNIYPFNIQTSTKTLEYLASGLQVISNKYYWIDKFCRDNMIDVIWLNDFLNNKNVVIGKNNHLKMSFEWNALLLESRLIKFINNL